MSSDDLYTAECFFIAGQQNAARAQFAAIQGGMGEAVDHVPDSEFQDQFQAWWEDEGQYCRAGGGNYERAFAFQAWRHLIPKLLQHQRITAAMAAEVERFAQANRELSEKNVRRREQVRQLRAELAELKGREAVPVAYMLADAVGGSMLEFQQADLMDCQRRYGGEIQPLYTTPPASPDVEGLLSEIRQRCSLPDWARSRIDTAISTWRQAHTPSTLPASSAEE